MQRRAYAQRPFGLLVYGDQSSGNDFSASDAECAASIGSGRDGARRQLPIRIRKITGNHFPSRQLQHSGFQFK